MESPGKKRYIFTEIFKQIDVLKNIIDLEYYLLSCKVGVFRGLFMFIFIYLHVIFLPTSRLGPTRRVQNTEK